jgi:hypothetical protein
MIEIQQLKERQEKVLLQYQISMQELELRPDHEQIMDMMSKFQSTRAFSSHEKLKIIQAERKLSYVGQAVNYFDILRLE